MISPKSSKGREGAWVAAGRAGCARVLLWPPAAAAAAAAAANDDYYYYDEFCDGCNTHNTYPTG